MRPMNIWARTTSIGVLAMVAAYCFVQYLSAAFAYSATVGLADQSAVTRLASKRAWIYLFVCAALQVVSARMVTATWDEPNMGSRALRVAVRYGLGVLISLMITGLIVGIAIALKWV
jgi:hypothetical protein